MEMTSTRIVNAPPDEVWTALNDPAVLKDAVPGCESFERVTDTEWRVVVAAKVGPVAARFNGRITLADLAPPTAYTMKFEGQGGAAGFANGEAKVSLAPSGSAGDGADVHGEGAGRRQDRAARLETDRRRRGEDGGRVLRALRRARRTDGPGAGFRGGGRARRAGPQSRRCATLRLLRSP